MIRGQPFFIHDYVSTCPTEKLPFGNSFHTAKERGDSRGQYLGDSSGKGEEKSLQTYVNYIKMSTVVLTGSADTVGHLVQLRITVNLRTSFRLLVLKKYWKCWLQYQEFMKHFV